MKKKFKVLVTWRLMIDFLKKNKTNYGNSKIKFYFLLKKQALNERSLLK